jgi:type I restriction enzyme, S subunit
MTWEIMSLNKVGNIFSGNSINAKIKKEKFLNIASGTPYIATKDISYDYIIEYDNGVRIPDNELSKFRIAHKNSIFICAEGGSAGRKLAFNTKDVCFVNKLFALEPFDFMEPGYVFYFYQTTDFQEQFKSKMTGLIGGVSIGKFKNINIRVPPLPVQKQIVAILDEAFEKISNAKEDAEKNLNNAKEVFESYLQSVFENKGEGWETRTLLKVSNEITDGSHFSPKSSTEEEYPYITVRDIEEDTINFKSCKFINKVNYQILLKNGCKPNSGDILFSKDGTVGKVSLIDFEKEFVVLSSLAIIRPKRDVIYSSLLKYILKNPSFLKIAMGKKTGAAIRRIILKNLKLIEINFPTAISEQEILAAKLDALFEQTKKLEAIYTQKLADLEELKQSILQKAFNGELMEVPA